MIRYFILLKLALIASIQSSLNAQEIKISPAELSRWQTLDKGKTSIDNGALVMEETAGADGYFLISPEVYSGNYVVTYKVKALSESSVLITLFSASQKENPDKLTVPAAHSSPQEIWKWRSNMQHYNLTFNNISHGYTPFFFKNLSPSSKGFNERLAENIATVGKWHEVEIGKSESRLWFKMDGQVFFDVKDSDPLKAGHLIFRISGTTGEKTILAKAAIKDLVISINH